MVILITMSNLQWMSFFQIKKYNNFLINCIARMAELVDALGSGSSGCTSVGVQVPLRAQNKRCEIGL